MKRVGMKNMMKLCEELVMQNFSKGSEIRHQSEVRQIIYFIKKGHVKLGVQEGDEFQLKQILGKGSIFGESKITMEEDAEPFTAVAMSNCTICLIEVDQMEELIERYPKLHSSIFKISGLKFRKIERRLDDILYKDAETRIRDFIIDFVNENGVDEDGVKSVKNIFSHSEIAKLTSTSRQTVNNVVSALRKEGEIEYSRREIRLNTKQEIN